MRTTATLSVVRARARQVVYGNRWTAAAWLSAPKRRICRIQDDTDVVIDGYWRSGNTYARTAFMEANPHAVVSSFVHHPYAVREAVRQGKPMILLVREPEQAVRSNVQYFAGRPVEVALQEYIHYYAQAVPFLDRVLVAPFEEVIGDFGAVIARCNERFGTAFGTYESSPENDDKVFAIIDHGYAGHANFEERVARPTPARASASALDLTDPAVRRGLARARTLYEHLVGAAGLTEPA